jgi:hypothetical protein
MDVVVWRDDWHKTIVKVNGGDGLNSDSVLLWLVRRQNKYMIK